MLSGPKYRPVSARLLPTVAVADLGWYFVRTREKHAMLVRALSYHQAGYSHGFAFGRVARGHH
jgi:hypothetical protein